MPLTPAQEREAARRRKANQRARERGMIQPYRVTQEVPKEEILSKRAKEHAEDLLWAEEHDATGRFYKSECRSLYKLLAIFEGDSDLSQEEEKTVDAKTGQRKKEPRPTPALQAIRIKAIETTIDGIKYLIDPNGNVMYENYSPITLPLNGNGEQILAKDLFEVNHVVRFREWLELRDKARKNLFWLGRLLNKTLYYKSHMAICDAFMQKNFDDCFEPDFTGHHIQAAFEKQKRYSNDGQECRDMLLLAPRGGYKSTVNCIDCIQWYLNCPDCRIMIMTSFSDLSESFLREIKSALYLPVKADPTPFSLLFPEYLLDKKTGTSKENIRIPAAVNYVREYNLWVTSMDSHFTGLRCDIRKGDDVVDQKNSNTEKLKESLKTRWDSTMDLIAPWGLTDIVGTRYFTDDMYGQRMSKSEDGTVAPYKYLKISAWTPKQGFASVPTEKLEEHMVDLWFPEVLSYKRLKTLLNVKKLRSFNNQQLNIATDPAEDDAYVNQFTEDLLNSHCIKRDQVPVNGQVFQAWDISYSATSDSDYSVGVVGLVYKKANGQSAICILDVDYGKSKSSVLVNRMINVYKKWPNTQIILIEESMGVDSLLEVLAIKSSPSWANCVEMTSKIYKKKIDNMRHAKNNRVKALEMLLTDDRLYFTDGDWRSEAFNQMIYYKGSKSNANRKDDIPDAMSFLINFLPRDPATTAENADEQRHELEIAQDRARSAALHKAMFATPYTPPKAIPDNTQPAKPADPRRAMINKIFGGNGMRA